MRYFPLNLSLSSHLFTISLAPSLSPSLFSLLSRPLFSNYNPPGSAAALEERLAESQWTIANRVCFFQRFFAKETFRRLRPSKRCLRRPLRILERERNEINIACRLPVVLFVLPDSYVAPEHKDYGGASLNTIKRTVKYLCPADIIPPYIDVDLSELDAGQKLMFILH